MTNSHEKTDDSASRLLDCYSVIDGNQSKPLMVTFRESDTSIHTLSYGHLVYSHRKFDGRIERLVLTFTFHTVTIEGKKLKPIQDALSSQRLVEVWKLPVHHRMKENPVVVTAITVAARQDSYPPNQQ